MVEIYFLMWVSIITTSIWIFILINANLSSKIITELPGSLLVKTPFFQCRRCELSLTWAVRSHVPCSTDKNNSNNSMKKNDTVNIMRVIKPHQPCLHHGWTHIRVSCPSGWKCKSSNTCRRKAWLWHGLRLRECWNNWSLKTGVLK